MEGPALPSVDIVTCTLNEEAYIDECLEHVLAQTYRGPLTIWLVDSGSTDSTVERLRAFAERDSRVRVFADGKRRTLPEALTLAMGQGDGEIVARVDAHGYPAHDFVERAVAALVEGGDKVACVGGRFEQIGTTPFGRALSAARESRFGVGGSGYASTATHAVVDTVPWGTYRRSALEAVGGIAEGMNYGEDEELNWRLRRAGYDIVQDARIRFTYYGRTSWRGAFRQYRNYGRARVEVIRAHPEYARPYHIVPAAVVAGGGALAVAAAASDTARKGLAAAVALYAVSAGIAAAATVRSRPASPIRVAQAFSALHFGYGIGMLEGFGRFLANGGTRRGAH
jgi:glycosyltransferase involved in cell wall biosynthesis